MLVIDDATNHVMRGHLVGDGYVTLAWPKDLELYYLEYMRTLVNLQIDTFVRAARRERAGDLEYKSWLPALQSLAGETK